MNEVLEELRLEMERIRQQPKIVVKEELVLCDLCKERVK